MGILHKHKNNENGSNDEPISTASIYFLEKELFEELKASAEGGELKAILKLYNYFSFSSYNKNEEIYWLKKACEAGDIASQYNYALWLNQHNQQEEALFWARKAAKDKEPRALDLIKKTISSNLI